MPAIGDDDEFESNYMAKLKAKLAPVGLLVNYEKDRAALDLGLHLYARGPAGTQASSVRVWLQAKGRHDASFSYEDFANAALIAVGGLPVDTVKYWYTAPEPVYLVAYVESVDEFLAADVRELVDDLGGMPHLVSLGDQQTMTLHLSTEATLERALVAMPKHRSMRIDGPSFRGRPLGHGHDPLRSELSPLGPDDFEELVNALLAAHDFRPGEWRPLSCLPGHREPRACIGTLGFTYEWVLPMMTEFGFDADSDFRIEGEPFSAHGQVLVVVDPDGEPSAERGEELEDLLDEAVAKGVTQALVFTNAREADASAYATWRLLVEPAAPSCQPQRLGSLAFNVLVTTNVYLQFFDRLTWRFVNFL